MKEIFNTRITTCVLVLMTLICILASAPAHCQEQNQPENFFAAGIAWNPKLSGNLVYAKRVSDGIYNFNFVDVVRKNTDPFQVTTSIQANVAKKTFSLDINGLALPVYITAGAGVSVSGETEGNQVKPTWNTGIAVPVQIRKVRGLYILPNIRYLRTSNLEGSGEQYIFGLLIGLGK